LRSSHRAPRSLIAWQVLSALLLLTMAAIHLYLTRHGVGGTLGKLFVLNGEFMIRQAKAFARRFVESSNEADENRIRRAFIACRVFNNTKLTNFEEHHRVIMEHIAGKSFDAFRHPTADGKIV
jgi:hypothetical protein